MTPEEYSKFIASMRARLAKINEDEKFIHVKFDFNSSEYTDDDGDIFFAWKNSRLTPGAHDKEQERAEAAAQGFEYMDNMPLPYLKKIRDNLYIDGRKQVHTRLTSIGGVLNVQGKRLNTEIYEEAIILDWNGVPTINGIRYNMSKHNRLHPKYNTFKYHPYFKKHETDD